MIARPHRPLDLIHRLQCLLDLIHQPYLSLGFRPWRLLDIIRRSPLSFGFRPHPLLGGVHKVDSFLRSRTLRLFLPENEKNLSKDMNNWNAYVEMKTCTSEHFLNGHWYFREQLYKRLSILMGTDMHTQNHNFLKSLISFLLQNLNLNVRVACWDSHPASF